MTPEAIRFGSFIFNPVTGLLYRGHQPVHLTRKAARFLAVLIEKRPDPVSKPELSRLIWPETVVTEGNLTNLALEVRRALGDDGTDCLKTVHRVGYAFIGAVGAVSAAWQREQAAEDLFRLVIGDRQVNLSEGENWIGRATDCRVRVDCSKVSRHHARIVVTKRRATLEDGPSRNGTFLGGKRLSKLTLLEAGDEIRIGSARMIFRYVSPESPTDVD
jgi:DNA-binding winged helix-turn-helix (wHTH) protein